MSRELVGVDFGYPGWPHRYGFGGMLRQDAFYRWLAIVNLAGTCPLEVENLDQDDIDPIMEQMNIPMLGSI